VDEKYIQLSVNKINARGDRNIKKTIEKLPGKLELFSQETTNELTNIQFDEIDTIQIVNFID
jgi:hypothetical protein